VTYREFRSDTMTLPTQEMRDAMRDAELGDDVMMEDPTVARLERMGADLLGKEAALLVPSGTFGNQCAVGVHCRPGDEVILSETTHVIDHEAGAAAALTGVQTRTVSPAEASWLTAGEIADEFNISKPSISHHLDILKRADLVTSEKKGQFVIYTLNTTILEDLLNWIVTLKK